MSKSSSCTSLNRLNEVKAILRSLLISEGRNDISVNELNAMYSRMEGRDIPFREFNYPNLLEFLNSMSDTLRLKSNPDNTLCVYHVNTEKSVHISSLVARQKKSVKTKKYNQNHKQRNFPNYYNILNQVLQEFQCSFNTVEINHKIQKSEILYKVRKRLNDKYARLYSMNNLNSDLYKFSDLISIEHNYIYFKVQLEQYKTNISPLNDIANKNLAFDNGSLSIEESKESIYPLLKDEKKVRSAEINSSNNIIPERLKMQLQDLIDKHLDGIWCSELPSIYKFEYNTDLDYNNLGFHSITNFIAALPEIFHIVNLSHDKKQLVVSAKTISNDRNSKGNYKAKTMNFIYNVNNNTASDLESVPNRLSIGESKKLLPDDVMNLGDRVNNILVTSLVNQEYIEIVISEIFTPSFFWIVLLKNRNKLNKLMIALNDFYNGQDLPSYKVPQNMLKQGLNIACIYDKVWHRGIIEEIKPNDLIVILFYDYGTVQTYSPNELYFLNKQFCTLPAQAIACGLYSIKPIGSNVWTNLSVNKFINKVWNIPLIAKISTINEEKNTMMITLTDTSDDLVDIHISDWMVVNKLAEWDKTATNFPEHKIHKSNEVVLPEKQGKLKEPMVKKENANDKSTSLNYDNTTGLPSKEVNSIDDYEYDIVNIAESIEDKGCLTNQINILAEKLINITSGKSDSVYGNDVENEEKENCSTQNLLNLKFVVENHDNFDTDVNENYNDIKTNFSEVDSTRNENNFLNQGIKNYLNCHIPKPGLYSYSSNCNVKLETHNVNHENECALLKEYINTHCQLQGNTSMEQEQELKFRCMNYDRLHVEHKFEININNNFSEQNCSSSSNSSKSKSIYTCVNNDNYESMKSCCNINEPNLGCKDTNDNYIAKSLSSETRSNLALVNINHIHTNLMYTVINLSERCQKKKIHMFYLNDEGWICASQFVDAFTNLKHEKLMFKLLKILQCDVNFKFLTRETDSELFLQLDKSTLEVPRENNKIIDNFILTLVHLKDMLHILVKLDLLNTKILKMALPLMTQYNKDIESFLYEKYNNKILFDVLNLFVQYRKFKSLQRLTDS
ncbi:PREDICTED: tudor domain-containing protein 5-like [Ceratosolen solmsi marchali]|uniref:Tudor domain-containing protein 5-like n=1 Tax=Ceratosolen solmsi marchali TaxID=326594 RepID=A0AAJ6VJQ2_9HYME|nr:PREDICTED: tudor domain-containing protein 5-like [Ceratosolen solmsi marchali]